jgi:hypothetical protein
VKEGFRESLSQTERGKGKGEGMERVKDRKF